MGIFITHHYPDVLGIRSSDNSEWICLSKTPATQSLATQAYAMSLRPIPPMRNERKTSLETRSTPLFRCSRVGRGFVRRQGLRDRSGEDPDLGRDQERGHAGLHARRLPAHLLSTTRNRTRESSCFVLFISLFTSPIPGKTKVSRSSPLCRMNSQ